MERTTAALLAGACALAPASARGEERRDEPLTNSEDEAAHNDNTPLPRRSVVRFEPAYIFRDGGGYTLEVKAQPTMRYDGFIIPGAGAEDFASIARVQMHTRSIVDPGKGVHETGLTDVAFLNGVIHTFTPRFGVGFGYTTVLPAATSPSLDRQQWQLGPSGLVASEPINGVQLSLLIQDYWTVVRPPGQKDLAYMTVQPFVTWHFARGPRGGFVSTDAPLTIDFTNQGRSDFPVNLGVGKAFSKLFVGSLSGWYTVAGANQGDIAAHVKMSFVLGGP